MGENVAKKFCENVKKKEILYLRITSRGDPVTGLPKKFAGFVHPCSNDEEMRKQISEDCKANISGSTTLLDCKNTKTINSGLNIAAHMAYLNIQYSLASNFTGGFQEVKRDKGDTVCRLVICEPSENKNEPNKFFVVFFNVQKARENPNDKTDDLQEQQLNSENSNTNAPNDITSAINENNANQKPANNQIGGILGIRDLGIKKKILKEGESSIFGGKVAEDVHITTEMFQHLMKQKREITQQIDLLRAASTASQLLDTSNFQIISNFDKGKKKPIACDVSQNANQVTAGGNRIRNRIRKRIIQTKKLKKRISVKKITKHRQK
jgi:hypothetical protein